MVHHTMNISRTNAPKASSSSRTMTRFQRVAQTGAIIATLFGLWSCAVAPGSAPVAASPQAVPQASAGIFSRADDNGPLPPALLQGKSRWVPVRWAELPGFEDDKLFEAWNAWLKSCERPGPVFLPLCGEARRLSIASGEEQRAWMLSKLQPFRVESTQGVADGLLTSYYEPLLQASRPLMHGPVAAATSQSAASLPAHWEFRQPVKSLNKPCAIAVAFP